MQTILGAGGAIGLELAKALNSYTYEIRLVSRNPEKVNDTDNLKKADLLKEAEVFDAVKGSSIVYLTAGLPYKATYWQHSWPLIMRNVIKACIANNAKLVFFDNIYMYDKSSLDRMTEDTFINPVSRKGKVRAILNRMIFDEVEKGKLNALVARSADYYGPGEIKTSMLWQTVINPLKNGTKANWIGSDKFLHSFTYVPDAGKATALLGNTPDAYNQVWHLPTAKNTLTGKEWIEAFAAEFEVKADYRTIPQWMLRTMGLFMPIMREMVEMYYQYDRDYVFLSDKFERRFNIRPTPYIDGIKITARSVI
ncbi:MAG: NAD-dependent epimerase/dehydratase family protein [Omnitrophica WOR_2 bacterium]